MRVLLIEDDSAMAQSIELMLKSEGFNVYVTDLGEEGIDLGKLRLRHHPPRPQSTRHVGL
jgi:two-component system cell cycle response regulator CtrA